ncbi:MAG: ferritin family protein [Deltaproteobacteria bacterium]|nr:ferritin family protein [Deltaproteobacteria bacterium]
MDPVHFTGKEVLDMAVKIEENGLKFYTDAGKTAKDKDVKALFKALAEDEGRHIRVFQDLKKLLGETENAEPFDEETESYLRAFADTEVFTSLEGGKKLGKEVSGEAEAIDYAIGMEKDSILFYYEILKMIREKDKAVVDSLIDQEKDHLKRLTGLRAGL